MAAFLLYEDSACCARAEEFCQELVRSLGLSQLTKQAWLCNELRQNRLRNIAVQETLLVDVVILSLHYSETAPREVIAWLKAWLSDAKQRPGLVIGLFEEIGPGDFSSLRAELEELIRQAGVDLLVQSSQMPEDEVAY